MARSWPLRATSIGGAEVERDVEVAGQQVAGAGRDDADRDAGAGELGAHLAHGAVAAADQHQVGAGDRRRLGHAGAGVLDGRVVPGRRRPARLGGHRGHDRPELADVLDLDRVERSTARSPLGGEDLAAAARPSRRGRAAAGRRAPARAAPARAPSSGAADDVGRVVPTRAAPGRGRRPAAHGHAAPMQHARRIELRRTNITASTTSTPANAVTDEAWPDGNDLVVRKSTVSCHSGRPRPSSSLTPVVASAVATSPRRRTARPAAAGGSKQHQRPAPGQRSVIATVAVSSSIQRSVSTSHAWSSAQSSASRPRSSSGPSGERSCDHQHREHGEQRQQHDGSTRAAGRRERAVTAGDVCPVLPRAPASRAA